MPSSRPNPQLGEARLGVIGGSGLYTMPGFSDSEERVIETCFGSPSDSFRIGLLEGMETVFLARHGRHHHLLPSEVPYKANIWAMRSLGVRWLISVSAVGSLRDHLRPCDMVVPDQLIDRTNRRPQSFFGEGCVAHVSLAEPFCPRLSAMLADAAERAMPIGHHLHRGGTYLCIEGPAFSTRAESELYRQWGCDIIGMTSHTEASLAREAELAYASLSMVTDYDCWHVDHDVVSVEMMIGNLHANVEAAIPIFSDLVATLNLERPRSSAHDALRNAIVTPPNCVPLPTRLRLDLLTSPYWGPVAQAGD
ncbi:S-methyl-5'-thioadenosine phosphorylase [cyanobiont of Ornithocercus magnificus]|nr:S-methyl-5'-thioadenosine phosphorylase [cyanobiont of Ornithocercus magnificus]